MLASRGSADVSAGASVRIVEAAERPNREASSISIQGMTGTPASAKASQGGSGRAHEKNRRWEDGTGEGQQRARCALTRDSERD